MGLITPDIRERPRYHGDDWPRHELGIYLPPKRSARSRWKTPIGIDLFCGAGGFSLGFMQAGFTIVAAVDNDEVAMDTYLTNLGAWPVNIHFVERSDRERAERHFDRNLKAAIKAAKSGPVKFRVSGSNWQDWGGGVGPVEHFWLGDAKKLTGKVILDALGLERGEVDVVFGGPPCQGFSTSGKRDVMDPRNSLVLDFARLVCEIAPKTVCMENVPGIFNMTTPDGIPVVDAVCRILEDGGMGGLDALRASLSSTAGLGFAKRNPARRLTKGEQRQIREDVGEVPDDSPAQLSLLSESSP